MKIDQYLSAGILVGCLLIVSCKEDDENEIINPVVGEWRLTTIMNSNCNHPDENESSPVDCNADFCMEMVVMQNGTFTTTMIFFGVPEVDNGTWKTSDTSIELCANNGQDCDLGTYMVSSTTLLITINDEESGCTIETGFTRIKL